MKKPEILSYWEGEKPEYIDMCFETLYKHCSEDFNITIFNEKTLPTKRLDTINHTTDYLKAKYIYENGGFWIDADTIVMQNLKPLVKLLYKHDFVGIPGFFGANKGSVLLKRWIDGMDFVLKNKNLGFSDLIQPLLKDVSFEEHSILTREMITPIYHTGDEFWNFFLDKPLKEYVTDKTYIVTLYNSAFSNKFKRMSRKEILREKWLISKMFKKALYENT